MKRLMMIAALLVSTQAFADANSDAFNAGTSFGKANASQGTGSLKNPGTVTGAIPGYTANPPQSGYYGGVTGGDGGLSNKGQVALGSSDAGQTIIDSGTKNPVPVIDPDAPFITIGKQAEAGSEGVLNGTNEQCKAVTVSKTTFENFQCDKDMYEVQTCTRTGTQTGSWQDDYVTKTFVLDSESSYPAFSEDKTSAGNSKTVPYGGVVISATLTYEWHNDTLFADKKNYVTTLFILGQSIRMAEKSDTIQLPAGQQINAGDVIDYTISNVKAPGDEADKASWAMRWWHKDKLQRYFTLTLVIRSGSQKWVPSITWQEACNFPKSTSVAQISSVCSVEGGDRTQVVNGETHTINSPCWQYMDSYIVPSNSKGNCGSLMNNPGCTRAQQTCTSSEAGYCTHQTETWQCQKTYQSGGLMCGGDYICKSGECDDTNGAGDSGFDTAVAKLAGLASAAEDVKSDTINVKAFTGQTMSCRKAGAGFSNCCKDGGWGQDTGLAACNSDEMALGKAKAKKVTVSVGERCDHEVLGVCVQKSKVYCVFGGKLARIIQEQGRRDQLHVSFGSGDNPNCRGITVPELQNIDFDRINFADFYEDLMNNQKIPDSSVMVKQVKDRIAAQVNQQTGGK